MGREFIMPGKIISGSGALEQAEGYFKQLGKNNVILPIRLSKWRRCI